jgi:hypothetical protein
MPFAGFKDFDDFLAAQKKKGKSDESAKKICGALKNKTEGAATDKDVTKAEAEAWVRDEVLKKHV